MVHKRSCHNFGSLYCAGDCRRLVLHGPHCRYLTRCCQFDIEADSCYPDAPYKYYHAGAFHPGHKRISFLVCWHHRQRFCGQRIYGCSPRGVSGFSGELFWE